MWWINTIALHRIRAWVQNGRKTIKKRGLFTLSVFSGIAKHHCYQTSKSPRLRREHQLLLLIAISKIWRFWKNKNKANAFYLYVCILSCYIGYTIYIMCKVNTFFMTRKLLPYRKLDRYNACLSEVFRNTFFSGVTGCIPQRVYKKLFHLSYYRITHYHTIYYNIKDRKSIFQASFIAESDKKFSAKWFFNLKRTIFHSAPNEMKRSWRIPETSFSL